MRVALVFEHPNTNILYIRRGVLATWLETRKEISIKQTLTRWGRINFSIQIDTQARKVETSVKCSNSPPAKLHIEIKLPKNQTTVVMMVNNKTGILFIGDKLVLDTSPFGKSVSVQGHFKQPESRG
jgi:hypothetical protein